MSGTPDTTNAPDARAPMAAAPMRYAPDGSVDWGSMWESFCALALDGGPPHRATLLAPEEQSDVTGEPYRRAAGEICRGVELVSGLRAAPDAPGWVAVTCASAAQARWLSDAIREENVAARCEGARLLLPVGASYRVDKEVKSVITAAAKTTHYWREHLPAEVKQALALQLRIARVRRWLLG